MHNYIEKGAMSNELDWCLTERFSMKINSNFIGIPKKNDRRNDDKQITSVHYWIAVRFQPHTHIQSTNITFYFFWLYTSALIHFQQIHSIFSYRLLL